MFCRRLDYVTAGAVFAAVSITMPVLLLLDNDNMSQTAHTESSALIRWLLRDPKVSRPCDISDRFSRVPPYWRCRKCNPARQKNVSDVKFIHCEEIRNGSTRIGDETKND